MSYVVATPDVLSGAASNLTSLGATLERANAVAAASTTELLAAAQDEVSTAIAALFGNHGQAYQTISAEAAAFQARFVAALSSATSAYTTAEAAAASPLQPLIDLINLPTETLFGRPLIGDGADGIDGTGAAGQPGGYLYGNGGRGGSGAAGQAGGAGGR